MIGKEEKPSEILIQRKTAFICLENSKLTIKELNGDIKEYKIEIPKTPEQLENEELKKKIKELESKLKEEKK
jgi:DNA polymerase III sliding clamp (beta) subunit (PCNA family)